MPGGYRTMDGIDINTLWYGAGIRAAVDTYREVSLPLVQALAMPHDLTMFDYAISERNGFQLLGIGQRPDRKMLEYANVYPIYSKKGYAVGTDLDTLRISRSDRIRADLQRPMREYPEYVLIQMLKVMMTDPGTNNAGFGFYNGQFAAEEKITAPPTFQQNSFNSNHTHYFRNNNATVQLSDITNAKVLIREHGHSGTIVAFIDNTMRQQLENMAAWTGSIIRSPVSDMVAVSGFGDVFELLGVVFHVTEMMPSNYILFVEATPSIPDARPLIMFEPPGMGGLQLHEGPRNDYPIIESFFDSFFGLKVFQRGAGVSLMIGSGGTSYTNPTFVEP